MSSQYSTPVSSPMLPGSVTGAIGASQAQPTRSNFSPLDSLVQRGQQVRNEVFGTPSSASGSQSRLYERATALSRRTSIRQPPYQPSPEPDRSSHGSGDDDTRSIRSINLRSDSGFSRSQRTPSSSSTSSSPYQGSIHSFQNSPRIGDLEQWQHQPSPLLNNAFRSSVASDVSFNSITDAAQRMSIAGEHGSTLLARRVSTDTVRSSEFGDDGRWGRAWNTRADDEESAYEESVYGDGPDQLTLAHFDQTLSGDGLGISTNINTSRGGLDSIASLWKGQQRSQEPRIQNVSGQEKLVSLTRSALTHQSTSNAADMPRHSYVPRIETQNGAPYTDHSRSYFEQTPQATSSRYRGHRSTDSSATIQSSAQSSPEGARVYVYPPTPSGSVNGAEYSSTVVPTASSAKIETLPLQAPLAPSSLLSQTHDATQDDSKARHSKLSGHPTGRAPPPPPPQANGYQDPNQYFQGVDQPIFGQKRAQAIADADGRMSMISDLDVETLRLDGSSRRDSSSTIATVDTTRLSNGSIYRDQLLQQQPRFPPFASPQLDQERSTSRAPPPLRAAKSVNTLSTISSFASTGSSKMSTFPATDTRTGPTKAEDFLSQGISHHEQGDLARSAFYFERSAKVEGGCVVGMCMFGMALREGWGARKDPVKGFSWIQRAAAKAGDMMAADAHSPRTESELKAIKSELKLSVYELAKCFCYGWGVKMDKAMALEYFELAAKLGDPDAQAEAGALYAAGKGCKKDLKKAAMYYRMAEQGGYDTVGLSWIHKDKYK